MNYQQKQKKSKLHYKKQAVNETQKKVLADTSSRIQEHIEGDYIKGGSWKTGETKLFLFPQICKELPNKYPERFPDFVQGKMLKREKYPKGSNEFEEEAKITFLRIKDDGMNPYYLTIGIPFPIELSRNRESVQMSQGAIEAS